ncbi:phosphoribosylanthranilate isomerase [Zavarzinia sp. CC-PAN008]|uniref:phosphoribosylanthranilate isomerase n=1 Tax=Zavarzinia sp. CC-PAN008 TaxID=3243332 RepID=UPI003F747EEA
MVDVKICGLNDAASVRAAVQGGARWLGFVFYPPSPRAVTPAQVAGLLGEVPTGITPVALTVDASDAELDAILEHAPVTLLQLHGRETPERVAAVKARFGLPVMKAVHIGDAADVAAAAAYDGVADMLLLDAKPPKGATLPGGNGTAFDWPLLADAPFARPWLLAGGLHAGNLAQAVAESGAHAVDVSSGIEHEPGRKDPQKIADFLALARTLARDAGAPT